MVTARQIIKSAYRKIGVYSVGETMSADEGQDGLEALTDMVDELGNHELAMPVTSLITHTLVSGVGSYTIGTYPDPVPVPLPANHIEVVRPQQYLSVYLLDAAAQSYPLSPMSATAFDLIANKNSQRRPTMFYVREGWPLSTLSFDAVPDQDYTLGIQAVLPLSAVLSTATLDTDINMPSGYRRLLIYRLAIDLAPEYGKKVTPEVATIAAMTLKKIKNRNAKLLKSRVDRALVSQLGANGTYLIDQGPA